MRKNHLLILAIIGCFYSMMISCEKKENDILFCDCQSSLKWFWFNIVVQNDSLQNAFPQQSEVTDQLISKFKVHYNDTTFNCEKIVMGVTAGDNPTTKQGFWLEYLSKDSNIGNLVFGPFDKYIECGMKGFSIDWGDGTTDEFSFEVKKINGYYKIFSYHNNQPVDYNRVVITKIFDLK